MTEAGTQKLQEIIKQAEGIFGVVIKSKDKLLFEHNADMEFPAASVGKLPIALYVLHQADTGAASLKQKLTVTEENHRPGTGILQSLTPGMELSIEDLLKLMLIISDNTAAVTLGKHFSAEAINAYLKSLGFEKTRLGIQGEKFDFGTTTAREMTQMLEGIQNATFLNKEYSNLLLEILAQNQNELGLKRHLPQSVKVAHKSGALEDSRHDVGIVFGNTPYIISVLWKGASDTSYKPDHPGLLMIARISEEVYKQFG